MDESWEYVGNGIVRGPFVRGDESKPGVEICTVAPFDDNREANARLIAAAPDLLQALDAVVDELPCACKLSDGVRCWPCRARAAVARARGES